MPARKTKKAQQFKIHPLTIDDALDLAGVLASGGLTGEAGTALAEIQNNQGKGIDAVVRLIMGALANRHSRDDMRGFLFTVWKTTEDEQAASEDKGITDRLEPRYDDAGELDKQSLYYRKLKRFHALPPTALVGLAKAVYESEGFADFLELLRMEIPQTSTEPPTGSNGSTDISAVK